MGWARTVVGQAAGAVGTAAGKLALVSLLVGVVFLASGTQRESEASSESLVTPEIAPDTTALGDTTRWGAGGEPDTSTAPADTTPTIDQDSVDEANPEDDATGGGTGVDDGTVDDFLTGSNGGTRDADILVSACRTAGKIAELTKGLQDAYGAIRGGLDIAKSFTGAGLPIMDPVVGAASAAWAVAAHRGAKAEAWAATFGASALCNTSETRRLTQAQFDFVRNVVNRGIEQPLPQMDDALAKLDSAVAPVAAAIRDQRIGRLFGRVRNTGDVLSQGTADAAADTAVWAAHEAMKAGDSMAVVAARKIREFQAELNQTPSIVQGRRACFHVTAEGDTAWVAVPAGQATCTASPGRMQQLMAAEASLNNAQLLHLNTLTARKMDLEYTRYQLELRRSLIDRTTAPIRAAW